MANLANEDREREARLCGEDLGRFDRERGVFDDSPPAQIESTLFSAFRDGYREANPGSR